MHRHPVQHQRAYGKREQAHSLSRNQKGDAVRMRGLMVLSSNNDPLNLLQQSTRTPLTSFPDDDRPNRSLICCQNQHRAL